MADGPGPCTDARLVRPSAAWAAELGADPSIDWGDSAEVRAVG